MSSPASPNPRDAMVVAGDEETRVLLRGLLRLHHFRIVGEAEGRTAALERLREATPDTVVVDDHLAEGSSESLVREVRRRYPRLRLVLVVHAANAPTFDPAEAPAVILRRPFRIKEFATAIRPDEG